MQCVQHSLKNPPQWLPVILQLVHTPTHLLFKQGIYPEERSAQQGRGWCNKAEVSAIRQRSMRNGAEVNACSRKGLVCSPCEHLLAAVLKSWFIWVS
jgi:hypothetical protein